MTKEAMMGIQPAMNFVLRTMVNVTILIASFTANAEPTRAIKAITGDSHRIALVIGNSAYTNSPLKNPVNDAKDIAGKLRVLGFDVTERNNLQTKQIGGTLREFRSKLTPGSVALVFYAGHGLQIKGENYLPAVDADINSEEDVPNQSLAVRQIMDVLDEAKTRLNLVFLDACRNNPYARSFRSTDRGLARVTAPSGTLISYATKPGSVSADGTDRNGLYTSKLLAQMDSNLPIELALKRIVTEVKAASLGKQEPWMEGSIEGDFCFTGCASGDNSVVNVTPAITPPSGGKLSLDDIKKNQEIRAQWDKWQQSMRADFDKVAALNMATDLQVVAWERFLASYSQNNPYSNADEALRAQAQNKKQAAKEQLAQSGAAQGSKSFRDCPDCPEMFVIPQGGFDMGGGIFSDPVHRVTFSNPFAIGKSEVTQGQWRAIMGNNPSAFQDCGDACPVEQVSWNDVQEFIIRLNSKTGKQYRLPSEAEWEYACRAGVQQEYCGSDNVDSVAWHNDNSGNTTHPVGRKQPNVWGLYDMSGNVWEWVEDSYHVDYNGAPTNGSVWKGGGARRVLRGGSWGDGSRFARAADRDRIEPSDRYFSIGFRLARMLP